MMTNFTGFTPELVAFLRDLRANNDREWFKAHQDRYERHVRGPALDFVAAMAPRLAAISPELDAVPTKVGGSLMRIHRDTRFSKDKTPYKTNVGIQFRHRSGKDVHAPGLYVHIEPGTAFLAAGTWQPASPFLTDIRAAIDTRPNEWLAARDDEAFSGRWSLTGTSLKRAPQGYGIDHPLIDDLRRKDFIAVIELDEDDALEPGFADRAAADFAAATPLMKFLCSVSGLPY